MVDRGNLTSGNFWQLSAKWEFLRMVDKGNLTSGNFWQLSAKWEFLRKVDKGNLTSGNFWQNMGRCKIVNKNLIVTRNEEEQVYLFSLRD